MKHPYVLERRMKGKWERLRDINGIAIIVNLTREQAAWVNQSCKADHRWIEDI